VLIIPAAAPWVANAVHSLAVAFGVDALSKSWNIYNAAPPANGGNAAPHGAPDHDQAIDDKSAEVSDQGATDIRKNQAQVDAQGNKVGTNRPDLQWTDVNGNRNAQEWGRSDGRLQQQKGGILCNDPSCTVTTTKLR
jgi:hypothetical protein